MSLISIVAEKGLSNFTGEHNCFLNSAIQVLWHLDVFRKNFRRLKNHICSPGYCIYCALQNIFEEFASSKDRVIGPGIVRIALADHFQNDQRFQLGEMDDAAECFENILKLIHEHLSGKGEINDHSCSCDHCLTHSKFSMNFIQQVTCECKATSEPFIFSQTIQYISAQLLVKYADLEYNDNLCKVLMEEQNVGSCPIGCGKQCTSKRVLTNVPDVITFGIIWQTDTSDKNLIHNFVSTIGPSIQLNKVFDSIESSELLLDLVAMVCYYGRHYSTFVLHSKTKIWLLFDDANVYQIGDNWDLVIEKCYKGRYQPLLLIYQNPNSILIPTPRDKTRKFEKPLIEKNNLSKNFQNLKIFENNLNSNNNTYNINKIDDINHKMVDIYNCGTNKQKSNTSNCNITNNDIINNIGNYNNAIKNINNRLDCQNNPINCFSIKGIGGDYTNELNMPNNKICTKIPEYSCKMNVNSNLFIGKNSFRDKQIGNTDYFFSSNNNLCLPYKAHQIDNNSLDKNLSTDKGFEIHENMHLYNIEAKKIQPYNYNSYVVNKNSLTDSQFSDYNKAFLIDDNSNNKEAKKMPKYLDVQNYLEDNSMINLRNNDEFKTLKSKELYKLGQLASQERSSKEFQSFINDGLTNSNDCQTKALLQNNSNLKGYNKSLYRERNYQNVENNLKSSINRSDLKRNKFVDNSGCRMHLENLEKSSNEKETIMKSLSEICSYSNRHKKEDILIDLQCKKSNMAINCNLTNDNLIDLYYSENYNPQKNMLYQNHNYLSKQQENDDLKFKVASYSPKANKLTNMNENLDKYFVKYAKQNIDNNVSAKQNISLEYDKSAIIKLKDDLDHSNNYNNNYLSNNNIDAYKYSQKYFASLNNDSNHINLDQTSNKIYQQVYNENNCDTSHVNFEPQNQCDAYENTIKSVDDYSNIKDVQIKSCSNLYLKSVKLDDNKVTFEDERLQPSFNFQNTYNIRQSLQLFYNKKLVNESNNFETNFVNTSNANCNISNINSKIKFTAPFIKNSEYDKDIYFENQTSSCCSDSEYENIGYDEHNFGELNTDIQVKNLQTMCDQDDNLCFKVQNLETNAVNTSSKFPETSVNKIRNYRIARTELADFVTDSAGYNFVIVNHEDCVTENDLLDMEFNKNKECENIQKFPLEIKF